MSAQSAPPPRGRRFGADLLRASAVLLVLVSHIGLILLPLSGFPKALAMLGHFGVELFFVLSGFLVGGLLLDGEADGPGGWRRFWARRWWRTLPLYYLFLLVNFLLARGHGEATTDAGLFVVFAQNLAWPNPIWFIEAWSLSVEEWFYLGAPLLVALAGGSRQPRRLLWALFGFIVAATLVRHAYLAWAAPASWDEGVRKVVLARLDAIAWGVLGAWWVRHAMPGAGVRRGLLLAGLAGMAAMLTCYLSLDLDGGGFAYWLLPLFGISLLATLPWLQALPRPAGRAIAAVEAVALWSYPLYLIQLAVLRLLRWTFAWQPETLLGCIMQIAVYFTMAMGGAALLHHYLEQPLLRWRDRHWARGREVGLEKLQ